MFLGRQYGVGSRALTALAAALVLIAVLNGLDRRAVELPSDGATWVDSDAGVIAARIDPEGPAAQVGLRPGDLLMAVGDHPTASAAEAARRLDEVGPWNQVEYHLSREGKAFSAEVVVAGVRPGPARGVFQGLLALVYLGMALLVVYRRPRDSRALLFADSCDGITLLV